MSGPLRAIDDVSEVFRTPALAEFLEAVSRGVDEEATLSVAVERAAAAFSAAGAAVIRAGSTFVATSGLPDDAASRGALACVPPDRTVELVIGALGRCTVVAIALDDDPDDRLLIVRRGRDAGLSPADADVLRAMGRVLAMAVGLLDNLDQERALLRALQERQTLLERLARIQRKIFHRAPLQNVLDTITAGAGDLLGDEVVGLRLLDPEDPGQLVMVSSLGVRPPECTGDWRTPVGEGVGGRAVSEARLIVVEDYAGAPFRLTAFADDGVRSAMAAPIFEHGRVVGSLTVATHTEGRRYSAAEREVLQSFAEHASLAVNDARAVEALHRTLGEAVHQATHDPLTGLVNRSVILDQLARWLSGDGGGDDSIDALALLFVDLDRFKLVNDSLGHDAGDLVLTTTAERLLRCVRPDDLVGRLAGDEFVVVCRGLHGEVDALGLADRICREIARPVSLPGRDLVVTASVGVARAAPGVSADQLLRDADVAMYEAKERGRDRTELFGKGMRARVLERVELEHSLRRGIMREEFRLHYQPSISLQTGRPVLVEALLRWEHPTRGLVSPDAFIPVAEDTRLIVPIGTWALREACREVATWRRSSPALADMQVSVNLSACQFLDAQLLDLVADALDEAGLEPAALWLEITESVVMDAAESTIATLQALKDLGVKLSVDDFGTGYSSLSYLKRFPVDVLKIDRSFVDGFGEDPEDEAIVTAVVRLAQALGKGVVAEGIENTRQLVGLSELGCDAAQGYFFSRPLPADQIVPWLEARLGAPVGAATA